MVQMNHFLQGKKRDADIGNGCVDTEGGVG